VTEMFAVNVTFIAMNVFLQTRDYTAITY